MTRLPLFTSICLIACLGVSNAVAAKPHLREVAQIDDTLFDIAVADVIRKGCQTIDARVLKAIGVMRRLKNEASSLGYSDTEIRAYVESDVEKDRMRARGAELFASRGVDPSNPDDLCRMGREEIAKNSQIGELLKAK